MFFFHINNKHENNFKLKSGLDKIVNGVQVSISGMMYECMTYTFIFYSHIEGNNIGR